MTARDVWARWVLDTQSGGDAQLKHLLMERLARLRDRVLKYAAINSGETVLDVGCGDGLIAFGALDMTGDTGRVIFSDISTDLLDHCRALAVELSTKGHYEFVQASADALSPIADESVDVVTTRSVLIYVKDKQSAFREFFRVLRAGGRVSLFEPINRLDSGPPDDTRFNGMDVTPVADLASRIKELYRSITPADGPMLGFDERDLVRCAEAAGFAAVKLRYEYEFSARTASPMPALFDAYLNAAPNPLAPSLNEAMAQTMTADERERFVAHIRPLSESGQIAQRSAVVYLQARKE